MYSILIVYFFFTINFNVLKTSTVKTKASDVLYTYIFFLIIIKIKKKHIYLPILGRGYIFFISEKYITSAGCE